MCILWVRDRRAFTGTYTALLDDLNAVAGARKQESGSQKSQASGVLIRRISPRSVASGWTSHMTRWVAPSPAPSPPTTTPRGPHGTGSPIVTRPGTAACSSEQEPAGPSHRQIRHVREFGHAPCHGD